MNIGNYSFESQDVVVQMRFSELSQMMEDCVLKTIEEFSRRKIKAEETKWVNGKGAAKLLGVDPSTISRWKQSGYITCHPRGGRDYYLVEELMNLKEGGCE